MFMVMQKQYPENVAFLILGILELYIHEVCKMFIYKHTETIELKIKITINNKN